MGTKTGAGVVVNVLMCITGLNKGGAEKVFTAICTRTATSGHDFAPVAVSLIGGHYAGVLREAGIETHILVPSASPLAVVGSLIRYCRFLLSNRKRIDIIHAFMADGGLLAVLSKWIIHKPLIYAVRSSRQDSKGDRFSVRKYMRLLFHAAAIWNADLVACNSPYVKKLLADEWRRDAAVIMNAIEKPGRAEFTDELIRAEYFSDRSCFYVVSVCNMHPPKDIVTLLHVAKKLDTVRFVLVGPGKSLGYFRETASALSLSNVAFAGFQKNVYPFLAYSQCYILLTTHEGFPNTVLEAMVSKIPVIMSDIPEVKGVLVNGENSFLVKNGDVNAIAQAIVSVRSDPLASRRLVRAAYTMVSQKFSYENMIRENYATYTRVLKGLRQTPIPKTRQDPHV
jgi:glycosyltransferase involved in cell wall biosynthesis